ncbi:MAG TPA: septum formation initiator family protein [Terriglobia bacterium]|nr:septum formation initiator family protein [Terriglobia bacterium]
MKSSRKQSARRKKARKVSGLHWRNENVRRAVTLGGVLLAIALVAQGIFGSDGLMTYLQKRRQYTVLHQQIKEMKIENQTLQKEVQGLKSNSFTIERYAREDLHMARQHELIYVLPQKPASSADKNRSKPPANPPQ